jgi:hypothetical protein
VTRLAAPLILAAHVDTLPTLPGWAGVAVYEGAALRRDDVTEYLTIGYVAGAADATVSFEPMPTAQGQLREAGTIASQLIVGAADVATARARVTDLLEPWVEWLGSSRTLGGRLLPESQLSVTIDLARATTRAGAPANALVTITYTATTYG